MMSRMLSAILMLLSLPLLLFLGLLIKIKYPGPIFYKQPREGQNGRIFQIWKLRTMVANANILLEELLRSDSFIQQEWDTFGCLKNDPRIAGTISKFVRQLSLDELPQLLNIFKGEMAFIGPRPLELPLAASLDSVTRNMRNSVLPGITGLWQVGPRSQINIRQMQKYDLIYIRKKNVCLNMYILVCTLRVMFYRTGA